MPNNAAYFAFLKDPDQELRRSELRTFFGPNAETFLRAYDKLREDTPAVSGGRPKFRLFGGGFEPAAFFLGPVWFFYRKMWLVAWVVVGLMIVAAFIPFRAVGLILGITLAGMAHRTYVQHAVQKLVAMHNSGSVLTPEAVQAAGGVSKPAGIISGSIYILLWIVGVLSVIFLVSHGERPY